MAESATFERPEVPAAPVYVDEVDHVAGRDAIDQVAGGSAAYQRETDPCQPFVGAGLRGEPEDARQRDQRNDGHQQRLERDVGRVEQAERRAGVADVREVEQSGHDLHAVVQRQPQPHERLAGLVERDHHRGEGGQ